MNRFIKILALTFVAVLAVGCEGRTDKVDAGGVILTVSDFDGLPINISAQGCPIPPPNGPLTFLCTLDSITIRNIAKNQNATTSPLMNVEIHSYEIRWARQSVGTRVPPVLVESVFGEAPVNGEFELEGAPILRIDQFENQPLRDLRELGYDSETGSTVIRMQGQIRFFGKTLSGDPVISQFGYFSIDFVP